MIQLSFIAALTLLLLVNAAAAQTTRDADPLAYLRPEHPRLMATADDFERVRRRADVDPAVRRGLDALLARADALLDAPVSRYEIPDGMRLLAVSRAVRGRSFTLAMAWRVTGDRRYADRLWRELEAVCDFPDWNPPHFLDTAEMAAAVAVGLDWCDDAWTPEQRERLTDAIVNKAFEPGLRQIEGPPPVWWAKSVANWNLVCHGGLAMAALAVGDDRPEVSRRVLNHAIDKMPLAVATFAPDGGYAEGPTYWSYAVRYLVPTLVSLQTAVGTTHGLDDLPGLARAGWFPIQTTGPTGLAFNFSDGRERDGPPDAAFYWLARHYGEPAFARYKDGRDDLDDAALDLLWRPENLGPADKSTWPLIDRFRGVEVLTMRSAWDDPDALYLAAQFGRNDVGHNQADLGTFVVESGGVRWLVDLGSDDYNLPGYFGDQRYDYFRNRTEGHNALVINPAADVNQDVDAGGTVTKFERGDDGRTARAEVDLTAAYIARGAESVVRTLDFSPDRVVLGDEVRLAAPGVVRWHAHTRAEQIDLAADGRSATLGQGGRLLRVILAQAPDGSRLSVEDARPLATSPDPAGQDANAGVRRLVVEAEGVTAATFRVVFEPVE